MSIAVSAANSTGELDYEWFESVAECESEADRLMVKTNADRFMAALRARRASSR